MSDTQQVKKRVLVIAYYFPPMGMSGVQRTLKLVKYLCDYDWYPTVLTITPLSYFAFDETLLEDIAGRPVEIIRTNAVDPKQLFKKRKTIPLKSELLRKIGNRLSQLFFIPDNKIFWKNEAVKRGLKELQSKTYHIIYSTAPPYTDHLVGQELKKQTGLPFVIDFRDAWIDNPYHFYWTPIHKRIHHHYERKVMLSANMIYTINRTIKEKLVARYQYVHSYQSIKVVPQGYDPEDFAPVNQRNELKTGKMVWVYTGVFYENNTPIPLYQALEEMKKTHPHIYDLIEFHMVGYVQKEFINQTKIKSIEEKFIYHGYVDHPVAIKWMMRADSLWLSIGTGRQYETISTGKFFEYLASKKPILAIMPDNDVLRTFKNFRHIYYVNPGLISKIKDQIILMVQTWQSGNEFDCPADHELEPYNRKLIASNLAKDFNMLAKTGIH